MKETQLDGDYMDGIDTDPWTSEEMDSLAAEDADSLGWEGMEAYQAAATLL